MCVVWPIARFLLLGLLFCTTAAGAVRVPFELHNEHIYLKARVNGSGPYYFLFDTGAGASGSMLDDSVGQRLGLKEEGTARASMIGGARGIKLTGAIRYTIGRLRFDEPKTALMPLADQGS